MSYNPTRAHHCAYECAWHAATNRKPSCHDIKNLRFEVSQIIKAWYLEDKHVHGMNYTGRPWRYPLSTVYDRAHITLRGGMEGGEVARMSMASRSRSRSPRRGTVSPAEPWEAQPSTPLISPMRHQELPDEVPSDEDDGRASPVSPDLHVPEPQPSLPSTPDHELVVIDVLPTSPLPAQPETVMKPIYFANDDYPVYVEAYATSDVKDAIQKLYKKKDLVVDIDVKLRLSKDWASVHHLVMEEEHYPGDFRDLIDLRKVGWERYQDSRLISAWCGNNYVS